MTAQLLALICSQITIHACMTGLRMSAPLQVLREGRSEAVVGLLLAFFAVTPIVLALRAGRLADKYGYHRPLRIAVALSTLGGLLACLSTLLGGAAQLAALLATAALAGAGANLSLIAIQRAAGRGAADATQLKRVFSWLGLAPALGNVCGPMLAGALIDAGGFGTAYAVLAVVPLLALASARYVPPEVRRALPGRGERPAWELLRVPGMKRVLFINLVMAASWDAHGFLLPIVGHELGFSASAIGLIFGIFAGAVVAIRLVIPMFAQRITEGRLIAVSMLGAAVAFAIYPLLTTVPAMAGAAGLLGAALGCVQPMLMSAMHQLTPDDRHGEAIALRSMSVNAASTAMPLVFGLTGVALGASVLFWLVGAVLVAGSAVASRLAAPPVATPLNAPKDA